MGLSLGAYLTQPVTEKHSTNEENDKLSYGVSSMQGWRETQEDAHNCILDFDTGTSLFAVYDGHGGNEVSEYTSLHLPNFIKENEYYKQGDYEKALQDSFVKFDCTLKEPEVVKVLQKLAKYNKCNYENGSESEDENIGNLKAEAQMPIEEVMAKYVSNHKNKNSDKETEEASKSNECSEVSSNETKCSSSKSHPVKFNESDSEVSSSSSSCVSRKGVSVNNNNDIGAVEKTLDSTSNGSEQPNNSSEVASQTVEKMVSGENVPIESTESEEGAASGSKTVEESKSGVNGDPVENVISSSVENGDVEESKKSKKGKALVKHQPKPAEKKEKDSSQKLFEKFLHSDSNEDLSDSDSDDDNFNGPESKSDDDDEDENEGNENVEKDENEEDDEEEEDEEEDDEDEYEEEYDSEEYEYENEMDRCMMEPGSDSGCTALVALIKDNKMYVANAGDCRCVVSKNGEAIEMSLDHKPENEIELERIEKAGGRVYAGRVNDGLNLSRALGDHVYKQTASLPPEQQMISPLPDIQVLDIDPDLEFMVLACDGIWNSMTSQEVIDFVRPKLQTRSSLSKICEEVGIAMFDHCLAPDTLCDGTGCDNMTAIIVQFKNSKFASCKKRSIDDSEAEESSKKQKTEDTASADCSQSSENILEKPSNSPDTTQ